MSVLSLVRLRLTPAEFLFIGAAQIMLMGAKQRAAAGPWMLLIIGGLGMFGSLVWMLREGASRERRTHRLLAILSFTAGTASLAFGIGLGVIQYALGAPTELILFHLHLSYRVVLFGGILLGILFWIGGPTLFRLSDVRSERG